MDKKLHLLLFAVLALSATAVSQSTGPAAEPDLPYSPSLDVTSIDRSVDPCVDFYHYSCGGWKKKHPIPPDQTSWSVYAKLYEDNLKFLRGILEQAASADRHRDAINQKIGDFYAACMDEAAVERRGIAALQPELDEIARLSSSREITPLIVRLQLIFGRSVLFAAGSLQDPDNSEQEIADLDQGGLGLPDRDYYLKEDAKSKETRARYLEHVQKVFELVGETPQAAEEYANTIVGIENALANASMDRVARRNPYNRKHKMNLAGLKQLAPELDWPGYYHEAHYPGFEILNVEAPEFFKKVNALIAAEPVSHWKTYLRFHVIDSASPYLSGKFADENFAFYRRYLRGATEQQPRWKRCVSYTDDNLGEALGQAYVKRVFSPELKQSTLAMVNGIEDAMAERIRELDWMSAETKQQALAKLHGIRNKIGYPDRWRDYRSLEIMRNDLLLNVERAHQFESRRDINKIGKPVDHGEWQMSPPTVDAYYDPQLNDINFPAGVLQPPLYDARIDDAPNYGNTGGTIGHELTHGFDDEGSQFDAQGNLRNWWTEEDRKKFDAKTKCVEDQYAQYVVVDEVRINSALTLGEDVADLGGEILAYIAWKEANKGKDLHPIDDLTPEQRFFIGFAQWDCANERPEDLRVRAATDPHSPAQYRINGVVVNMAEFSRAFSCKVGQAMTKPPEKVCRVW